MQAHGAPSSRPTCSHRQPLDFEPRIPRDDKDQRTRQRAVMISSVIARKSRTGTKPAETLDLSKAANLGAFRWRQSRSSRSVRGGGIRRRRRLIPTNMRQSKTPADGRGDLPTPFRYSRLRKWECARNGNALMREGYERKGQRIAQCAR